MEGFMSLFSFFKRKESSPIHNTDNITFPAEYGKKQMRERADSLLHSETPNAIRYMSDGSGYLYVGTLVYICRADQKMNSEARNIIIEFIRKYSRDEVTPNDAIENQLRRWITPSRRQFALDVNAIVESGKLDILRDIYSSGLRIIATLKKISELQEKAIEKLAEVANFENK
jgi:hypothetical protein